MALTETRLARAVRAERIAAGGRAVARLADGRVCFVPRAAPGDLMDVEVTRDRGSWVEGRIARLRKPGPGRRAAPCPYYDRCGGCSLQHLDAATQLAAKAGIVGDALRRLGGWNAGDPEVVASPAEWRYRSRMTFTLRRLGGGRVVAGLYRHDARGRVLDVDGRCLLPREPIAEAWDALRGAWGEGARRLPPGRELRLTLRLAPDARVVLVVEGGAPGGEPAALLEAVPALAAVWHRPRGAKEAHPAVRAATSPDGTGASRPDEFEGTNAFSQVNPDAAALLADHVSDALALGGGERVVDAYAGDGVFGRAAARAGARVVAIERDPAAVRRGRALGPDVDFREGSVEALLEGALPADAVIANPPRAGLSHVVAGILRRRPPARLLYASCDPATLARDIARLRPSLEPRSARAFDLFPQTARVETVVELCAIT